MFTDIRTAEDRYLNSTEEPPSSITITIAGTRQLYYSVLAAIQFLQHDMRGRLGQARVTGSLTDPVRCGRYRESKTGQDTAVTRASVPQSKDTREPFH